MNHIEIATGIARAAACLDDLKRIHAPAERAEAERHVDNLHAIAAHLAGDRAHEIYGADEQQEVAA